MTWVDLAARAAGLSTHLMPPPALDELVQAGSRDELAVRLARLGWSPDEHGGGDEKSIEQTLRRRAGEELAVLARWAGARTADLAVVFDDEDRRAVRAVLRGLVAGASAEARLAGTVPTPSLPESALAELARQPSAAAVARFLASLGHGFAAALAGPAATAPPDLLALEQALARSFVTRARRPARRGGAPLVAFVTETIDAENAAAALQLAERGGELEPDGWFLPGGARLDRATFVAAAAKPARARALLAERFAGTPLAEPLATGDALAIDAAALEVSLATQRRLRRFEPQGPATLLAFILRRRRETFIVRRAAWRCALSGAA